MGSQYFFNLWLYITLTKMLNPVESMRYTQVHVRTCQILKIESISEVLTLAPRLSEPPSRIIQMLTAAITAVGLATRDNRGK